MNSSGKRVYEVFRSKKWGHLPYDNFLLLHGNSASGKTYFTKIWNNICKKNGKYTTNIKALSEILNDCTHAIIDDIDHIAEHTLLHMFNILFENKIKTLMTTSTYPIQATLPDLRSRVNSIRKMYLVQPNEKMINNILINEFKNRSISISHQVIKYLLLRLPKDFKLIMHVIKKLDDYVLRYKKKVNIVTAKRILNDCKIIV